MPGTQQEPKKQLASWWRFVPWPWGEPTSPLQYVAGRLTVGVMVFLLICAVIVAIRAVVEASVWEIFLLLLFVLVVLAIILIVRGQRAK